MLGVTNLSTSLYERSAPFSVRYFPGERDFGLTVNKVEDLISSEPPPVDSVPLISAKDVGYEAGARYFEDGNYLGRPAALAELIRTHPRIFVTRARYDFSESVWPDGFAVIRRLADPVWVSPSTDFTIWQPKRPA